ncbi:hypothetical protein FOA52_009117 [Chlamydomonas sp. UWO 241]|nr:hypothetical protein FOA52_009117 [Chlamydomonas sp. UWO 241]
MIHSVVDGAKLRSVMVGSGSKIGKSEVFESVVGTRGTIGDGCLITRTVYMGADYYEDEKKWTKEVSATNPYIGIGNNCIIGKAIIDKNVRIGHNCELLNREGVRESMDRIQQGVCIRDGIVIVSKSSVIPDGTKF